MKNLDWQQLLDRLSEMATSQRAHDLLKSTRPLADAREAEASFAEIFEAQSLYQQGRRPHMESLDMTALWLPRLEKEATLKTLELKDVRHFCIEIIALNELLRPVKNDWAERTLRRLMRADEALSAIDQIMTSDGEIRSDASQTLFQLFNEKKQIVRQTQSLLDKLIHQHELETVLQDRYVTNREGRWVLPVQSGRQHQFEGIIHASSHSKQTVFMEPKEIIPLNNRLRQIEVDIEEEIERLLRALSEYLRLQISGFRESEAALLATDVRLSHAQLASQMNAQTVTFSDGEICLPDLKHPLLALANPEVVPNDIELNMQNRLLLLSGPNAGGKTVLLKAVGLAAQMARCGLLVATSQPARLPFFKDLFVGVGDSQSVDEHLSTFAAHLKILSTAATKSGKNSMVLIDEICGSTDPEEGTALARAFIERLASTGCFGVITSHLGPLKQGWSTGSGVINGSLEYDTKSGQPTYRFVLGIPGQSLALQTAKRVGIDSAIIERALEYLSPGTKRYHSGLEEIESIREELRRQQTQLRAKIKDMEEAQKKFERESMDLEREKSARIEKAVQQAETKIQKMIEESQVEDVFKRHERLTQIRNSMPEIIRAQSGSGVNAEPQKVTSAKDFAEFFPPGSRVFVNTIGRDGIVQSAPNNKGEVAILSQSMRLQIHWQNLNPAQKATNPTRDLARRAGVQTATAASDRQVDVRGKTLEEAIHKLEEALDQATLNQEGRIKVIHGHGTDTLKKGIRNFLTRSVYVTKWFAGSADSGGDGVTWVELA